MILFFLLVAVVLLIALPVVAVKLLRLLVTGLLLIMSVFKAAGVVLAERQERTEQYKKDHPNG